MITFQSNTPGHCDAVGEIELPVGEIRHSIELTCCATCARPCHRETVAVGLESQRKKGRRSSTAESDESGGKRRIVAGWNAGRADKDGALSVPRPVNGES